MSYLVIARKYRPSTFDNLIGQKAIVTTLKNAIHTNRVAHAYLFAGPRGVGKTSMARILSKALNCDKGPSDSPCNACDVCKSISNGNDVDVLEIDGASNRGIDEIRNIRQNVNYAPSRSQFKIYIIDEVHMLTKEAFNALLKTLEEPPSHVKFIFATTNVDKLPETVQSRCQRFDFKNISLEDIKRQLSLICKEEDVEAKDDVFQFIAKYARGGLRDALSVLDQLISFSNNKISLDDVHMILGTTADDELYGLINSILKRDLKSAVSCVLEVLSMGKDTTGFTDQIIWYLRDLLLAIIYDDKNWNNNNLSTTQTTLLENNKNLTVDSLTYMIQILSEVKKKAKDDRHRRILLEVAIIKLSTAEDLSSISALFSRIENLEKRLANLLGSQQVDVNQNKKSTFYEVAKSTVDEQNKETETPASPNSIEENKVSELVLPASSASNQGDELRVPDLSISYIEEDVNLEEYENFNTEQRQNEVNNKPQPTGTSESLWENILTKIQSKKKSLWATLKETRFISFENGLMILEFASENKFHKERIERAEEKKTIENSAEEVAGNKIKFKFTLGAKKKDNITNLKKQEPTQELTQELTQEPTNENAPVNDKQVENKIIEKQEQPNNNIAIKEDPSQTKVNEVIKDDKVVVNNEPISRKDIINKDCVKKAIEIFDGRIVDIRRIKK